MNILKLRSALMVCCFSSATGCASIQSSAEPVAMQPTSCVARVFANQIEVVGDKRVIPLPEPRLWTAEGLTEDGRAIVSRTAELNLATLTATPIAPELPGAVEDVSADGSKIILSRTIGEDRSSMVLFDRTDRSSRALALGTTDAAISQDGVSIAEQSGEEIRAYQGTKLILAVKGRLASWLDRRTLAYLRPTNDYEIVDIETGRREVFTPVGTPLVPLQRSRVSGALLYVSRTRGDFWSLDLSCPERFRIVVHEREDGGGSVIGFGCKASRPEAVRWINAESVCSVGTRRHAP